MIILVGAIDSRVMQGKSCIEVVLRALHPVDQPVLVTRLTDPRGALVNDLMKCA